MKRALFLFSIFVSMFIVFTACGVDDPEPEENTIPRQLTIVYAVNENNLSYALEPNKVQMLSALEKFPKGKYVIMLFQTYKKDLGNNNYEVSAGLFKAVSGKTPEFTLVKDYSRSILSTDPARMREVISDALEEEDGEIKNLFFWGHGSAWTPTFSTHSITRAMEGENEEAIIRGEIESIDVPDLQAFGGDKNIDFADLDELNSAIPAGVFDTIWFDCCYMSNIETVYELRNKCKWIVAYPTEIAARGLPYDKVLPYVFSDSYDLVGGARTLYDYYVLNKTTVTVSVLKMDEIEEVAKACRAIYKSGEKLPEVYGLQNYSRHSPYYDLVQYAREYAQANDADHLVTPLINAMSKFVIYTDASEKGFNNKEIVKANYSGVSTHYYVGDDSASENYYRTLDWYKATRL